MSSRPPPALSFFGGWGAVIISSCAQLCWVTHTGLLWLLPSMIYTCYTFPANGSQGLKRVGQPGGAERAQTPSLKNLNPSLQKSCYLGSWRWGELGLQTSGALSLAGGGMQQLQLIKGLHLETRCWLLQQLSNLQTAEMEIRKQKCLCISESTHKQSWKVTLALPHLPSLRLK